MKRAVWLPLAFLTLSTLGCAAAIEKEGYLEQATHPPHTDCSQIAITKNLSFPQEQLTVVGKIRASDNGFSAHCSEQTVLDTFRNEACTLGADVIHITREKHPSLASTCYRAEADFVRLADREIAASVDSDAEYSKERIAQNSKRTKCLNNGMIPAAALGGLLGVAIQQGICSSADNEESVTPE